MSDFITPNDFIYKWSHSKLSERSGAHEHFIDLCHLLNEPTPSEVDIEGFEYTFEKGLHKTSGKHGWADVWKKGCFAWEYKSKHKDLKQAYFQLQQYSRDLENPPLLIVSDMQDIIIHTNWTNTVSKEIIIHLHDFLDPNIKKLLIYAFEDPEKLKPEKTRAQVTEEVAKEFSELAKKIISRNYSKERVTRFLNKLIFCMFAEDIFLLPDNIFTNLMRSWLNRPNDGDRALQKLFKSMRNGDYFGANKIDWFNGGLFEKDDDVIPLQKEEIKLVLKAAKQEWSDIDPVIFGTLYETCLLDGTKQRISQGAHYTDAISINRIIKPVIIDPLNNEWTKEKLKIIALLKNIKNKKDNFQKSKNIHLNFLKKIQDFKIFDPACGSGNFLNVALQELKELEYIVIFEGKKLGFEEEAMKVDPQNVMGIDINLYATELAKVSIWISYLQWMWRHGFRIPKNPILKKLENIENRDALINENGTEATWPAADVIIGNPPFLGDKKMLSALGDNYVKKLRNIFKNRVPASCNLVVYWIEKAKANIIKNHSIRAGLVATTSIRNGKNRIVLDDITNNLKIYNAWSDLPWIVDGASVRVSIINFCKKDSLDQPLLLDGKIVKNIYSNISSGQESGNDITKASYLITNKNIAYQGVIKSGPFEIDGRLAREWIIKSHNPQPSCLNSDVIKPWVNGIDITNRFRDKWIIDFGVSKNMNEASLYEMPFEYLNKKISKDRKSLKKSWWLFECTRLGFRESVKKINNYIVTPRVSKHRIFVFLDTKILPDSRLIAITSDNEIILGILQSHIHEVWSLSISSRHGIGDTPTYNIIAFESFPFPEGLTPNLPSIELLKNPYAKLIKEAAKELNELRNTWLNPTNLIIQMPEVIKGYPDRILPIDSDAENELKKRTLTKLYNSKPQWLIDAHKKLDDAVAKAYGWDNHLSDDLILKKLLELNLAQSNKQQ